MGMIEKCFIKAQEYLELTGKNVVDTIEDEHIIIFEDEDDTVCFGKVVLETEPEQEWTRKVFQHQSFKWMDNHAEQFINCRFQPDVLKFHIFASGTTASIIHIHNYQFDQWEELFDED